MKVEVDVAGRCELVCIEPAENRERLYFRPMQRLSIARGLNGVSLPRGVLQFISHDSDVRANMFSTLKRVCVANVSVTVRQTRV